MMWDLWIYVMSGLVMLVLSVLMLCFTVLFRLKPVAAYYLLYYVVVSLGISVIGHIYQFVKGWSVLKEKKITWKEIPKAECLVVALLSIALLAIEWPRYLFRYLWKGRV